MCRNFVRVHLSLKTTPAIKAGIANRKWTVEDVVDLLPVDQPTKRGPYKKGEGMAMAQPTFNVRDSVKLVPEKYGNWRLVPFVVLAVDESTAEIWPNIPFMGLCNPNDIPTKVALDELESWPES